MDGPSLSSERSSKPEPTKARSRTRLRPDGPKIADIYEYVAQSLKTRWKRYRKKLKRCQRRFSEDAVHDSRIETRRLLSLIELLRAFFPADRLKKARRLLKQHLDTFDELRDTHVQLLLVERMLRAFPGLRPFYAALRKHERRCTRETAKAIKKIKTDRLSREIRELQTELREQDKESSRCARGFDRVIRSIDRAFDGVGQRGRRIDPSNTATIHCTRIAFKKFRYMVEALAPLLPGVSAAQLEAMQEYQAMMGDIQDTEVLLSALDKFLRKGKIDPDAGQKFRDELLRMRQWLIKAYLSEADRLQAFWPLPGLTSGRLSRSTK